MDECNCCSICLKVEGEACGGSTYRLGRCDHHLFCNITGPYRRDPVGICTSKSSHKDFNNQRQYIPMVVRMNTGARTTPTYRYPSTKKTLKGPSTTSRVMSLSTNGTMRTTRGLIHKNPTKETLSSSPSNTASRTTGSPSSNKTLGFVSGERKNIGISKDTESTFNSPVDTKPAVLFLIASGILIAFLVVLVACFGEKFKKRKRPQL